MCHGESLKNVVEEEPLSQTQVDMAYTKNNKILVKCVNKNSKRLICLTNQLKILPELEARSLVDASLPPYLTETQLPQSKITLNCFEYQFVEL